MAKRAEVRTHKVAFVGMEKSCMTFQNKDSCDELGMYPSFVSVGMSKIPQHSQAVMTHTFNTSTQEAEASRSL